MHNARKIDDGLYYVGVNDHRITRFENTHPLTKGMAYNSFLLIDDKTVLLDTVDRSGGQQFMENVAAALAGRKLDYLVINHMEPDHCALIVDIFRTYPEVILVGNKTTFRLLDQFYGLDLRGQFVEVKEGDTLSIGKGTLRFFMAPMVHWPEVMVTYEEKSGLLFSADAFGTFGTIEGSLFTDAEHFEKLWLDEGRRYYTNIIGKYGMQTLSLLNKIAQLKINMVLPLHGPLWRDDIASYFKKYRLWASYAPEEKGVVIAVGSIYGNTEEAADIFAGYLADFGVKNIVMHNVSSVDPSFILSDIFRYSHVVLISVTYNFRVFPKMETLVTDIVATGVANRTFAIIENGSWAPAADNLIRAQISKLKNARIINQEKFTIKSALKSDQLEALKTLARQIAETI
ncbi:MAG: FprA family A-type flavoprotein [Bacilli bacterium]|nr:FprA family A-type flavoprotein [Bacilli bacterium]